MNELKLPLRGQVPFEKPCLKAKIPQITVFKALSYVYKHRAF